MLCSKSPPHPTHKQKKKEKEDEDEVVVVILAGLIMLYTWRKKPGRQFISQCVVLKKEIVI
jgi:hypothetical protein